MWFWAYGVIFFYRYSIRSAGHQIGQFANDLFDSDFTTKSRIVVFVPPIARRLYAYQLIESRKSSHSQNKLNVVILCILLENRMGDYNSAFSSFVGRDFRHSVNKNTEDDCMETKHRNICGALNVENIQMVRVNSEASTHLRMCPASQSHLTFIQTRNILFRNKQFFQAIFWSRRHCPRRFDTPQQQNITFVFRFRLPLLLFFFSFLVFFSISMKKQRFMCGFFIKINVASGFFFAPSF